MSNLTYQSSLTYNTSPIPSTYLSSSHTLRMLMRNFQTENWTNLAQLKETDGKLRKSCSSDLNLEPDNLNMKSNGKDMRKKTIGG